MIIDYVSHNHCSPVLRLCQLLTRQHLVGDISFGFRISLTHLLEDAHPNELLVYLTSASLVLCRFYQSSHRSGHIHRVIHTFTLHKHIHTIKVHNPLHSHTLTIICIFQLVDRFSHIKIYGLRFPSQLSLPILLAMIH